MIAKFKIWITQLSAVAKIVTVLISFIVGVVGGVIAYNKYIIKHYEQEQAVIQQTEEFKSMQHNFKVVIDSLGILSNEVRSIKPEIVNINTSINDLNKKNNNLKGYMMESAKTTDELLKIVKIWETEKKNYDPYSYVTPLKHSNTSTQ